MPHTLTFPAALASPPAQPVLVVTKMGAGIQPALLVAGAVLVLKTNNCIRYALTAVLAPEVGQQKTRYELRAPAALPLRRSLRELRRFWKLELVRA